MLAHQKYLVEAESALGISAHETEDQKHLRQQLIQVDFDHSREFGKIAVSFMRADTPAPLLDIFTPWIAMRHADAYDGGHEDHFIVASK